MANMFANSKALVFDLMGTCCDWHSSIMNVLETLPSPPTLANDQLSQIALDWRAGFFAEIHSRFEQGLPQEGIDETHRRVLDQLLLERGISHTEWDDRTREKLVEVWHTQIPWPDAIPALKRLREKYFVVVLANGTTRLQLDIAKSSGLQFHMLFSSQLLGLTKPDLRIYQKAAQLMGLKVDECIMVAAHAYDTRAAKEVGMKTLYVRRTTEDVDEDFAGIEKEFDLFVDGRDGSEDCGIAALAKVLLKS